MSASNEANPLSAFSRGLAGIIAAAAPGVARIERGKARASGFVWKPGLVITAEEALPDDGDIAVSLAGGLPVAATLVGRDPSTDVALLKVETGEAPPVVFADQTPATGALALVASAGERGARAALTVVAHASGPWQSLRGGDIAARIELGVFLRRASQGALALDMEGRAFGMAVVGPRRGTLVIPAATINRVAGLLAAKGRMPRGWLGASLQRVGVAEGQIGLIALSVEPGGPAAAAGLLQGDVIVSWNGAPAASVEALARSLGPDSVGQRVAVAILRAGARSEHEVVIGERPGD